MEVSQFEQLIEILKNIGIQFVDGLTDEETHKLQDAFTITFPPDLKLFLQLALPISDRFVDWRGALVSNESKQKLWYKLDQPLEGILFDVANNKFWLKNWGDMPDMYAEKEEIVKQNFINYPKLVPIYSHRYIPSEPIEFDNPIFSVYQTDVIYYGYNIADYFAKEFHFELPANFNPPTSPIKDIPFWSDLI
jgi:hypothetical protein